MVVVPRCRDCVPTPVGNVDLGITAQIYVAKWIFSIFLWRSCLMGHHFTSTYIVSGCDFLSLMSSVFFPLFFLLFFFCFCICFLTPSFFCFCKQIPQHSFFPGERLRAFERPSALSPQHTISLPTHTQNTGGHGRSRCTRRHADTHMHKQSNVQHQRHTLSAHTLPHFVWRSAHWVPVAVRVCDWIVNWFVLELSHLSPINLLLPPSFPLSSPTASFSSLFSNYIFLQIVTHVGHSTTNCEPHSHSSYHYFL